MNIALEDFAHSGDRQSLLWDMQRAGDLQQLTHYIDRNGSRRAVERCLDDFERNALPVLSGLSSQVIHNDLNPGNVLLTHGDPPDVAGVIDFGDMLRAPVIVDVAVAASYLRRFDGDPLASIVAFVGGFHSVRPIGNDDTNILYDLVRTRLATTITILYWRMAARGPGDEYLDKVMAESTAERFLERIDTIPRQDFVKRIRDSLQA